MRFNAQCAPAPPAPAPRENPGLGRALPTRVVSPPLPSVARQPSEALVARDAPLHTSQTRPLLARAITQPRHISSI